MVEKNHVSPDCEDQEVITENNTPEQDNATAGAGDNMAAESDNKSEQAPARETEDWKDKYMRLQAEFDNYRKRTLKEKMELVSYGCEDLIKILLPVLDDTDRALDAMNKTEDIESVRTGIVLVSKKLRDALTSQGLCEIEAVGNQLDTDLHDAVAKIPAEKKHRGKVVDVVQKGYKLKDKVVRHAKCVVGE